jgi:MoaA/NifB/PqqE/SkfB family radical SAM enzyme
VSRLVVELTNRCNLRCGHCYDERHAATGDLPSEVLDKVLAEGHECGIDHLSFTGGEPTIHPDFDGVVRRVCRAGYTFSFVSNGVRIPRIHALLVEYRRWFQGATFSLDGAREATHDALRGPGSYRQVLRAASVCVVKDLPFTLNMVITAQNRGEVAEMVELAARLGSGGVRFGHLMPSPDIASRGLELSLKERRDVENEIWRLREIASVLVAMAPGYFSESPFFPCAPLELEEFNLDYRGNLTLCCHLSGYRRGAAGADVLGDLRHMSLGQALERFRQRVRVYLADKRDRVARGELGERDHFPCLYCVKYLNLVPESAAVTDQLLPRNQRKASAAENPF